MSNSRDLEDAQAVNDENARKIQELQRQLAEYQQDPKQKYPHETFSDSAIRRFRLIDGLNAAKVIFQNIANDLLPQIPPHINTTITNMRLGRWPNHINAICIAYNTDQVKIPSNKKIS